MLTIGTFCKCAMEITAERALGGETGALESIDFCPFGGDLGQVCISEFEVSNLRDGDNTI